MSLSTLLYVALLELDQMASEVPSSLSHSVICSAGLDPSVSNAIIGLEQ